MRRRELLPAERSALMGEPYDDPAEKFFILEKSIREAWEFAGESLLAEWVETRPGTRPPGWWRFEAPSEVRNRMGGVGTPAHEVLAHAARFDRGVPVDWVEADDVEYYNGRAVDTEGEPIGTEFAEGDFPHEAYDPDDPPRFESEPAFLRRRGLLLPGELERIPAEAFEPVGDAL